MNIFHPARERLINTITSYFYRGFPPVDGAFRAAVSVYLFPFRLLPVTAIAPVIETLPVTLGNLRLPYKKGAAKNRQVLRPPPCILLVFPDVRVSSFLSPAYIQPRSFIASTTRSTALM
jgi:hypothetical protein